VVCKCGHEHLSGGVERSTGVVRVDETGRTSLN
jgi:hypothetical protein